MVDRGGHDTSGEKGKGKFGAHEVTHEVKGSDLTAQDQYKPPVVIKSVVGDRSAGFSSDESPHEQGEVTSAEYPRKVTTYGQQLQIERNLKGWTQEELANQLGKNVSEVQKWETNQAEPDLEASLKLSHLLGNDFYLSLEVLNNETLRLGIVQKLLTTQTVATIFPALTELHIKCWLIVKGRDAELIEYVQTRNTRFPEEANLIITRISYNSPLGFDIKLDASPQSLMSAIIDAIDGIIQAPQKLKSEKLDNLSKELMLKLQELEANSVLADKEQSRQIADQQATRENEMALLEQEKKRIEIESQRLILIEQRLELQKKQIEYALEIASKMITTLRPEADQATKTMLAQTLLPNLLQLGSGQALNLALPATQNG